MLRAVRRIEKVDKVLKIVGVVRIVIWIKVAATEASAFAAAGVERLVINCAAHRGRRTAELPDGGRCPWRCKDDCIWIGGHSFRAVGSLFRPVSAITWGAGFPGIR